MVKPHNLNNCTWFTSIYVDFSNFSPTLKYICRERERSYFLLPPIFLSVVVKFAFVNFTKIPYSYTMSSSYNFLQVRSKYVIKKTDPTEFWYFTPNNTTIGYDF
jgi:hypothetical protein